jgi:small-conductance mechanosensitive channel
MPIRLVPHIRMALLLAALLAPGVSFAQQQQPEATAPAPATAGTPGGLPSALARLEPIRLQLDQIELSARRDRATDDALAQMRASLDPIREKLRAENVLLQQELTEADARLGQLGAAPAVGAVPENETIAAERKRIAERRNDIDAALKQTRLLSVRADSLAERITDSRRSLFARELFVRTSSTLDPSFWRQAAEAIPGQARGLIFLVRSWGSYALESGGFAAIAGATLTLGILFAAAIAALRWLRRRDIRPLISGTRFANSF